ncbi:hypothetical protein FPQ18DRAFT_394004 [Pyronema domesticum]|nr:hypothetical protein FPQ18DRAFT_394004 [Pyronema domesticum]
MTSLPTSDVVLLQDNDGWTALMITCRDEMETVPTKLLERDYIQVNRGREVGYPSMPSCAWGSHGNFAFTIDNNLGVFPIPNRRTGASSSILLPYSALTLQRAGVLGNAKMRGGCGGCGAPPPPGGGGGGGWTQHILKFLEDIEVVNRTTEKEMFDREESRDDVWGWREETEDEAENGEETEREDEEYESENGTELEDAGDCITRLIQEARADGGADEHG